MAAEAQISHSVRKAENAENTSSKVARDEEKQKETLDRLQKDLQDVRKAAEEAQGDAALLSSTVLPDSDHLFALT